MYKIVIIVLLAFALPVFSASYGWYPITAPNWFDYFDIEMQSPTNGWLCGYYGTIAKFNGSNWNLSPVPGLYLLNGISATSDANAWAVGNGGVILHYNGSQWEQVQSGLTTHDLNDVWMLNSSDGWIVGDQTVLRYNGSAWYVVNGSGLNYNWKAIWAYPNPYSVWISGSNGRTAKWVGSSFLSVPTSYDGIIYGIWFNGSPNPNTSGWCTDSSGRIMHYEGLSWSQVSQHVTTRLYAVTFSSPLHGWIVGEAGAIFSFNGVGWSFEQQPTLNSLFGVSMISDTKGYAVGANGTILEYGNTTTVEPSTIGMMRAFYH
jgi:photosystem II stability/assembly factor-like uncharacterized protein